LHSIAVILPFAVLKKAFNRRARGEELQRALRKTSRSQANLHRFEKSFLRELGAASAASAVKSF
jgi:hypothetical protein